jgi:hypothetical protein
MMIYAGGFGNPTNIILLVVYLISGIFGLFLGDLAFGDARRKQEKKEKQAAEELLLQAKRRDEREKQRMANENARTRRAENVQRASSDEVRSTSRSNIDDDDFDYDKYMSDIDKMLDDMDDGKTEYDY